MSSGSKVKLLPRQRADLGDVLALQSLVYDHLAKVLGALLGPCSGTLSEPNVLPSSTSGSTYTAIPVSAGVLVGVQLEAGLPVADIVFYDPASPLQSGHTTVDLSGLGGAAGWIWWAREAVDADELSRVFWGAGAPVHQATMTRQHDRAIFTATASATPPADGRKWHKLGRITSWTIGSLGSPGVSIRTLYALDPGYDGLAWDGNRMRSAFYSGTAARPGLSGAVTALVGQLARLADGDTDVDLNGDVITSGARKWDAQQGTGILQIINELATLNGGQTLTKVDGGIQSKIVLAADGTVNSDGLGSGTIGTSLRINTDHVTQCVVLSLAEVSARALTTSNGSFWICFRHPTVVPKIGLPRLQPVRKTGGNIVIGAEVVENQSFAAGVVGSAAEFCVRVALWGTDPGFEVMVNIEVEGNCKFSVDAYEE